MVYNSVPYSPPSRRGPNKESAALPARRAQTPDALTSAPKLDGLTDEEVMRLTRANTRRNKRRQREMLSHLMRKRREEAAAAAEASSLLAMPIVLLDEPMSSSTVSDSHTSSGMLSKTTGRPTRQKVQERGVRIAGVVSIVGDDVARLPLAPPNGRASSKVKEALLDKRRPGQRNPKAGKRGGRGECWWREGG